MTIMAKAQSIHRRKVSPKKIYLNKRVHFSRIQTYPNPNGFEHKFRRLIEHMNQPVMITNAEERAIYVNPQFCKLLGYSLDEVLGHSSYDFCTKESADMVRKINTTDRKSGIISTYEVVMLHKSGTQISGAVNGIPLEDGGTIGIFRDLRSLKAKEEEIRIQRLYAEQLFLHDPRGVLVLDNHERIVNINAAFTKIFGYTLKEIRHGNVNDFIIPEHLFKEAADLTKQIVCRKKAHLDTVRKHKNGTLIPVCVMGVPIFIEGKLVGIHAIYQDITHQVCAEEALAKSEERFRSAFENANIGVAIVGLDGSFIQVNKALCKILGYSLSELLQLDFQTITCPGDLAKSIEYQRRLLSGEIESFHAEKNYFHKNGSVVSVILSVSIVRGKNHEPLHFVSQFQDITKRKQAEEALRVSEKRFSTLISNLPGMVYRCRPDAPLSLELTSEGCFELTGWTKEELTDGNVTTFDEHIHPEDQELKLKKIRQCAKEKKPFKMMYRIFTKSGDIKWVWEQGRGIYDSKGDMVSFEGIINDVTHQKTTEAALAKSEERYALAARGSNDGLWDWNIEADERYYSPRFKELLGYSDSEITSEALYCKMKSCMDPHEFERKENALKRHLKAKTPYDIEFKLKIKSGEIRWFQSRAQAIWGKNGKPIRVAGSIRDITPRKIAEQNLKRRMNELNVLYQVNHHLRMAAPLKDVLRNIAKDVVLTPLHFTDFVHACITFDNKQYHSCRKKTKLAVKMEEPIMVSGQKRGTIEVGYIKILPEMSKDPFLKEERRLLKALAQTLGLHVASRQVFERHEKLLNKMNTGVFILEDGIIRYANPKFYRIFKAKECLVIKHHFHEFVLDCPMTREKREVYQRELKGRCANGKIIDVKMTTQLIDYHSKEGVLGTIRDITDLKRAQEHMSHFNQKLKKTVAEKTSDLIKANKRLESLNRLKDEFIAVTSHELRSPLTAVRGYLSFLRDPDVLSVLPENIQQYLIRAYNNTDVLNNLVNNILDVSRIESGRFELKKTSVDLAGLIKGIIDNLVITADKKKISVHFHNATEVTPFVAKIDHIRIHQVIVNILENAMKYSKRSKPITITLKSSKDHVRIEIADQGIGIPKTQIPYIFDKFMQAKNAASRYKGGAGLGLFITKKIVELHSGSIDVTSQRNRGTIFTIELPLYG